MVHVSPSFSGGIGSFVKQLIDVQLSEGVTVAFLTFEPENSEEIDIVNFLKTKGDVHLVKKNLFFKRPMLTGVKFNVLKKILKNYSGKEILIHAHNPVAIGFLGNVKKYNVICTIHGINVVSSFMSRWTTKVILKKLLSYNKKVIAVSNHTKNYYNGILNKDYIETIYNGTSIAEYNISKIKKNIFTIGYVSRLVEGKGWEILIEAFTILKKEYLVDLKMIICGDGDEIQKEKLVKLLKEYDIENSVEYLGYVSNASNKVIPILDLFILPSESEGLPMSIIESLGHGVPVLATAVGGIPEVLKDDYNGKIILPNAVDIAEKIYELYANDSKLQDMKFNAKYTYNEFYSIKKMTDEYKKIYEAMMK